VFDGVAIMVGLVVGIGIFKTPALVATHVDSEAMFLGVWVAGGLVTLAGALCYAELASAYPHAGGEYHFLRRAYGAQVAVLFGWARGTVIQTGAIAAVSFVYGDYANQLIPLGPSGPALHAAAAVALLTALNCLGTQPSSRAQGVFTLVTILAILGLTAAGFLLAATPAPTASPPAEGAALGMAMILVLLTYGGWSEAAYLSAEIENPARAMGRVLIIGTAVLTAVYVAVNAAFLAALGLDGLRGSSTAAADLMRLASGEAGAALLSAIVVAAALSTLNASLLTGARVYYAMGRDIAGLGRLAASLATWSDRGQTPTGGLLLQGAITLALIGFGASARDGFQAMVDYTAPVFWSFLLLVGVALFVLRWREPGRPRPFRVPAYPVTPLLFCASCLFMLHASLAYTGAGALIGLAVIAAGLPLALMGRPADSPAPAE
jgi:amino acid transporter